jgi:hypothetical protein
MAPSGRFLCPSCGVRLVGKHRWFYWPLLVVGCCIMGGPLSLAGAYLCGLTGALIGGTTGCIMSGIPFDRYLEERFSVLKPRQ